MPSATAYAEELREPVDVELPEDTTGAGLKEKLDTAFDGPWQEMLRHRPKWATIGAAVLPARAEWCFSTTGAGEDVPSYATMMDSAPTLALRTLSSGLSSKLSNPQAKWFAFTTTDPGLDAQDDVDRWLDHAANVLYAIMDRSNFYAAAEQVYLDCAAFATAGMDIQPDRKTIIRCATHPIGSFAIAQDARGRVNQFEREYALTAFQMAAEFGTETLPPEVIRALKNRDRKTTFVMRHMIYPNEYADEDAARFDKMRMAFKECYWLKNDDRKDFAPIAEGYFAEWPIPCPRWGPVPGGRTWGSFSPGYIALPDILMLYNMKVAYWKGLGKKVDPVTVSGNAFRNKKVWSTPGANNVDDQTQGDPQLRAAYQVQLELNHVAEEMERVREQIRDVCYTRAMTPMLLRLQNQNEQPTALQAGLATDESYGMLSPIIEGFADQFHDLAIDRIFGIAWRAGKIEPPPQSLQGAPLRVVLKSQMAQAQLAVGVQAIERHLQFSGAVASMYGANALDPTDSDEMIRTHARLTGLPRNILRTPEMQNAIRQTRVQAQTAQMAVGAAPQLAKAKRDNAEAEQIAGTTSPTGLGVN